MFFDNRPGFLRLLEAVEEGKVNTVIVKDLSRLGRNYVEVGRTVEDFLDVYGIRLISINDNVDTIDGDEKVRDIIIPFFNMLLYISLLHLGYITSAPHPSTATVGILHEIDAL